MTNLQSFTFSYDVVVGSLTISTLREDASRSIFVNGAYVDGDINPADGRLSFETDVSEGVNTAVISLSSAEEGSASSGLRLMFIFSAADRRFNVTVTEVTASQVNLWPPQLRFGPLRYFHQFIHF